MKIVFIRHSEPIPSDSESERLFRTGQMIEYFDKQGVSVEWLVSSFNHFNKQKRDAGRFRLFSNGKIEIINSVGYEKNISISRVFDHIQFGFKSAYRLALKKDIDAVITSFPTITSTILAVAICRVKRIPIYIDYRDKWPEVFYSQKKGLSATILKTFSFFVEKLCGVAFKYADGLLFPTSGFRDYAAKKYSLNKSSCHVSPLGYNKESFPNEIIKPIASRLEGEWNLKIVFAGTIGQMFDFDTIFEYAKREENSNKLFILCGEGQKFNYYKNKFVEYSNILFLGWVNKRELDYVFNKSDMALAPYLNIDNFLDHVPNKIIEYMSYGLPTLTCLKGESEDIVRSCGGGYYTQGNVKEFSDSIELILSKNKEELRKIGIDAQNKFDTLYSSQRVYGEVLSLIQTGFKSE